MASTMRVPPLARPLQPPVISPCPTLGASIYLPSNLRAALPRPAAYGPLDLAAASLSSDAAPRPWAPAADEPGSLDADTIVAVVTGATQGAVSIVRLSGWDAVDIASAVFRPAGAQGPAASWDPESHRVYYGHAYDSDDNRIDEVLALVMLGPRSFTAEDVVEIHAHGGGVCARRVVQACLAAGARLAKPGEFTLRAFLNGRLDLSQAEAVAALVDARTVAAADSALAGLGGGLGREVAAARTECLDLLVEMDARLDFDEDLPPLDAAAVGARVAEVAARVSAALATARQGQLLSSGLQVALVGRPNVGKSSLLNALSGTERAIVTDIAGTTRDVVEAGVVVGGLPVTLLDTAGLRQAEDKVEAIGVERSVAAARAADVVVMVVDGGAGWTPEDAEIFDLISGSRSIGGSLDSSDGEGGEGARSMPPSLLVVNKADLEGDNGSADAVDNTKIPEDISGAFSAVVRTSATTGAGLEALRAALLEVAGAPELAPGGVSWAVNERQAEALTRAAEALGRAQDSVAAALPVDFWTIDLRAAVMALGEVSGEDVTEEVLDAVFSRFCIGK